MKSGCKCRGTREVGKSDLFSLRRAMSERGSAGNPWTVVVVVAKFGKAEIVEAMWSSTWWEDSRWWRYLGSNGAGLSVRAANPSDLSPATPLSRDRSLTMMTRASIPVAAPRVIVLPCVTGSAAVGEGIMVGSDYAWTCWCSGEVAYYEVVDGAGRSTVGARQPVLDASWLQLALVESVLSRRSEPICRPTVPLLSR